MALYEATIPARYCRPLIDYTRVALPGGLGTILAAAGIEAAIIDDADGRLTIPQWEAFMLAVARQTGRSDIGFEVGRRFSVDLHGALAPALLRCPTLDSLLRLLARYFCLITPSMMMDYRRQGRVGELVYRPAAMMSREVWQDFMEIHAVAFHTQLRKAVPHRVIPHDVYLAMAPPPHLERYETLHPVRFHFGPMPLPEVRMLFQASELDSPLLQTVRGSAGSQDLSRLRERLPKARNWGDWVALILREADGCQPTLRDLANLINVGERTLARRLANEGRSFRDLAVTVRNRRACHFLAQSTVPITQIAYQLGFTELSNFTLAFRKLNGVSPSEFRRGPSASRNVARLPASSSLLESTQGDYRGDIASPRIPAVR